MFSKYTILSFLTARVGALSQANVIQDVTELRDSYDFIIAGGGTCGLTVADRLTEAFPNRGFLSLRRCQYCANGCFNIIIGSVLVVEYGES